MICKEHGELTEEKIKISTTRGKKYMKCRACENVRARAYHLKNKEKRNEKAKQYYEKNKEMITAKRKAKPQTIIRKYAYPDYTRDKQNQYRQELNDTYIKKLIKNDDKNISHDDIPAELVDLKRSVVQMKRTIKMMAICDEKIEKN